MFFLYSHQEQLMSKYWTTAKRNMESDSSELFGHDIFVNQSSYNFVLRMFLFRDTLLVLLMR